MMLKLCWNKYFNNSAANSVVMIFSLLFAVVIFNSACTGQRDRMAARSQTVNSSPAENRAAFLDTLQHRTFLFFWEESNPENGLVKDRSTATSPASIAAVGFGLAAWGVGARRGWITRDEAATRTLNALHFFLDAPQNADAVATGYRGFYYHFLDMKSGLRMWNCELSTIDSAWLLAGVRFAVQFYDRDNPVEEQIRRLGDSLTNNVDWAFMTLPEEHRDAGSVAMGWFPEKGFSKLGWMGYNEAIYLYILAAGSGYRDAKSAYHEWLSTYRWEEPYPGLAHATFPPLFGHQYAQIFIDFRGWQDEYMQDKGIDYFENSRRATLTQRRYAMENPRGWTGYDSLTWGLTACDGPGASFNFDDKRFLTYAARGTSGPQNVHDDDGTIAPTAAAGSIVFAPEAVIPSLQTMYDRYGNKGLWGKYGFVDAFNPTLNWYDTDYLGIDQGPVILMIENYRSGLIWKYCMQDPVIRNGLEILGFSKEMDR